MKITVHGAAGDVTGSAYLLETEATRILVDFGMFQGGARLEARNIVPKDLRPADLDVVLLTHAHLDHCGRLPLLVRDGFAGRILATKATVELAGLILRDSAKVQHYDSIRINRRRERAGKSPVEPLYDAAMVERTEALWKVVPFGEALSVAEGIQARFLEAGHMLGSASIELTVEEEGRKKVVVFSGDLGPSGLAIIRDSQPFNKADMVFMESTYGDRDNRSQKETLDEFREIIEQAVREKKRILVPAFAVGRTQQILYHLDELFSSGEVTPFPVYLDSPMAIEATRIYRNHPDLFDEETLRRQNTASQPSRPDYLHLTPSAEESMQLNKVKGPCLIMAGSGMCTGGRILHHLKHGLWRNDTAIMFVGYQGEGSLGRRLVEGAELVRVLGEEIRVQAETHTLNGFSAHAGQTGLLQWLGHLAPSRPKVVLTHGEERGRKPLAEKIKEAFHLSPTLPQQGDKITL